MIRSRLFNRSTLNVLKTRPLFYGSDFDNKQTDRKHFSSLLDPSLLIPSITVLSSGVGVLFAINRYRVSNPDEYLVRTGLGISDMWITKQGFQFPFQTYKFVQMHPKNYSFDLQAMSVEKMEFLLPCVFTIGPKDDTESLKKYVKLLPIVVDDAGNDISNIEQLVKGILEGETRIQSAQMTVEEIFKDKKAFKEVLIQNVQNELDQFGLQIYNANIQEMKDSVGSEYFSFLRQKKRSESENKAKVDVAEAKKTGDIGDMERKAATRQQIASLEADTVLTENIKRQEIEKSNAELSVVNAAAKQKTQMANIEAEKRSLILEAELQKEVEQRRIAMETEKLRASGLSQAQVYAEIATKEAEGKAKAMEIEAVAKLFAKQKEADGILAIYNAQSTGIQKLIDSFDGNKESFIQYSMLDKGIYEKLAQANAAAIKGLNPKISIWGGMDSSNGSNGSTNYGKPITDILKMVPPLVSTIHEQTGMNIKPPSWIVDMSDNANNVSINVPNASANANNASEMR